MPTVPTLEAPNVQEEPLPGRPFPRMQESVEEGAFGGPIGQGLEHVSQAVVAQQAKEKQQNDQLRIIDADTQLKSYSNTLLYGTPDQNGAMQGGAFSLRGADAINLQNKYLPQYDQFAANLNASLTPDQQRVFSRHTAETRGEIDLHLSRYEFEQSNTLADEIYSNATKTTIQSAASGWRDPAVLARTQQDILGLTKMQGQREGWTPDIESAHLRDTMSQLHSEMITSMVASGATTQARNYLYQNFQGFDAKAGETAQRMIMAAEEHQDVVGEKQREKAADGVLKQGLELASKDQLTPSWAFQHSGPLKAHELQFLLNAASGKELKTDPGTYAELLTRANEGRDITQDATTELSAGRLALPDYTRLVDMSGKARPNYVKAGVDYINQSLQVDQMNPDPSRATSKANALRDWDDWVQGHPDAEPSVANRESEAIAHRYLLVDPDQSILTLHVPRYLVGSRTQPDIQATEQKTVQALQSGEISQQEAARQALLLKQWRKALDTQQQRIKPKAAPNG